MLAGLEMVDWVALDHAYGPADDLPQVIRAAASTDEEQAEAAVDELFSSVFHQGTVYSASVAVVPFVAELATTPTVHHRFLLVDLLGGMADPLEADGLAVDTVRGALTAQVPRLLPLLADPDRRVRETAAYTLAQCPEAAEPIAAWFRERWVVEEVPLVRASVLAAGSRLDPFGWTSLLVQALGDAHSAVRAAAAMATVWAGLPWPNGATEAVISAYAEDDPLTGWVWTSGDDSLLRLLERFDDVSGVPVKVLGALVRSRNEAVRGLAAYVIEMLNNARRSAPAKLVPLLAPLLADADEGVRLAAVNAVRRAGSAGALVADELAVLAARCAYGDETDRWEPAAEALCALIQLGDSRWRTPLMAALRNGWAPSDVGVVLSRAGVAADPELLAAVRWRLARIHTAAGPADPRPAGLIPDGLPTLAHNERAGLVCLLGSWGTASAPAVPELIVALERGLGTAAKALMAIGPAAALAVPALRVAARQGDLDAATALWRLAGDPDPLLSAVEQATRFDRFHAPAIERLLQLGEHARRLLPELGRLLTGEAARTFPERDAQIEAARVTWRLVASPEAVLPTVRAVLAAGDSPAGAAARLAGELGTHARPLRPLLLAALEDRWARVHAARALWRLEGHASELVEPLLASAAEDYGGGGVAVDLLVEMRATDAVPRLRQLAEQDARIVSAGIMDEVVHLDERLQARLRQAIQQL